MIRPRILARKLSGVFADIEKLIGKMQLEEESRSEGRARKGEKEIGRFVAKVNNYLDEAALFTLRKIVNESVKRAEKTNNTATSAVWTDFSEKARNLLCKNGFPELAGELLKIDPAQLKPEMFLSSSIFDVERDVEVQHDSKRFISTVNHLIPENRFLINDGIDSSKIEASRESADQDLYDDMYNSESFEDDSHMLERVSRMNLSKPESIFDEAEKNIFLNINKDRLKERTSVRGDEMVIDCIKDDDGNESESMVDDLHTNLFEQELEKKSETPIDHKNKDFNGYEFITLNPFEFNETMKAVPVVPQMDYLYSKNSVDNRVNQKQLQTQNEIIILNQDGYTHGSPEPTGWIYVMGLPYEIPGILEQLIKDIEQAKGELLKKFGRFGFIEDIEVYPFNRFLEVDDYEMVPALPIQFEDIFNDEVMIFDESKYYLRGELLNNAKEYTHKNSKKSKERDLFKGSDKIMSALKERRKKRFDKSYACIKFADPNVKEDILKPDLRVLGMQIMDNICKVDDLDYKRTLFLYNIPYGTDLEDLADWFNLRVEAVYGEACTKIKLTQQETLKVIVRGYILIRFNTNEQVQAAVKAVNGHEFKESILVANIFNGSLKKHGGIYTEMLDIEDTEFYMERMGELRKEALKKIDRNSQTLDQNELHSLNQEDARFINEETFELEREDFPSDFKGLFSKHKSNKLTDNSEQIIEGDSLDLDWVDDDLEMSYRF